MPDPIAPPVPLNPRAALRKALDLTFSPFVAPHTDISTWVDAVMSLLDEASGAGWLQDAVMSSPLPPKSPSTSRKNDECPSQQIKVVPILKSNGEGFNVVLGELWLPDTTYVVAVSEGRAVLRPILNVLPTGEVELLHVTLTVAESKGSAIAVPAPSPTPDEDVLDEAKRITSGDRQNQYGPPDQDFQRTAAMWSALKGVQFTAQDVAAFMIVLKLSRQTHQNKRDNWVDIAGYARCGSLCRKGEEATGK